MNRNSSRLVKLLSKSRKTGKPGDSSPQNPERKSSRKQYKFDQDMSLSRQNEIFYGLLKKVS